MDALKLALLRSRRIAFTYEIPVEYQNARAAYHSGYEAGWRDWDYDNPYTSSRHRMAYCVAYNAADRAIREESTN